MKRGMKHVSAYITMFHAERSGSDKERWGRKSGPQADFSVWLYRGSTGAGRSSAAEEPSVSAAVLPVNAVWWGGAAGRAEADRQPPSGEVFDSCTDDMSIFK